MSNTTYIITGVGGALAGGIAERLADEGSRVIGLSRNNPNIDKIEFFEMDLSDEDSIENAVKQFESSLGNEPVFLLNIASVMRKFNIEKGEIARVYSSNVMGEIYLTSMLLEKIKETEGDVLNVSSTAGTKGVSKEPIYSSSKWAVRGFTKSLQEQFKDTKCRAIDFAIGGFISKMAEKAGLPGFTDTSVKPNEWIPLEDVIDLLYTVLHVPKSIQVSELVADRKKR